jgi:hypothetical protein
MSGSDYKEYLENKETQISAIERLDKESFDKTMDELLSDPTVFEETEEDRIGRLEYLAKRMASGHLNVRDLIGIPDSQLPEMIQVMTTVWEWEFQTTPFSKDWSACSILMTEEEARKHFNSKHQRLSGPHREMRWVKK